VAGCWLVALLLLLQSMRWRSVTSQHPAAEKHNVAVVEWRNGTGVSVGRKRSVQRWNTHLTSCDRDIGERKASFCCHGDRSCCCIWLQWKMDVTYCSYASNISRRFDIAILQLSLYQTSLTTGLRTQLSWSLWDQMCPWRLSRRTHCCLSSLLASLLPWQRRALCGRYCKTTPYLIAPNFGNCWPIFNFFYPWTDSAVIV